MCVWGGGLKNKIKINFLFSNYIQHQNRQKLLFRKVFDKDLLFMVATNGFAHLPQMYKPHCCVDGEECQSDRDHVPVCWCKFKR